MQFVQKSLFFPSGITHTPLFLKLYILVIYFYIKHLIITVVSK